MCAKLSTKVFTATFLSLVAMAEKPKQILQRPVPTPVKGDITFTGNGKMMVNYAVTYQLDEEQTRYRAEALLDQSNKVCCT